uniref:Peroxisomal biogenesis factor 5 n=1 Tax=Nephromyces sp. MMRI TaxID=2496275 RepID=A0A3S5HLV3_9APIC|nr:peroxisomal biogenesis factor 5 [Nephromyces sp. MMRI]
MSLLWNKIGATTANFGYSNAAIHAYEEAIKTRPNYPRVWANLGIAHSNLGDHQKAISSYATSLSLNPNAEHIWHYIRLAAVSLEWSDMIEAANMKSLEHVRELLPTYEIYTSEDLPPPLIQTREDAEDALLNIRSHILYNSTYGEPYA